MFIKSFFKLEELGTDIKTEVSAGITTFMTMSYIIFVQPAVLSVCGMDFGAVMVATCLSSAIATFIMGFYANYPIALAPAMGHNFFFVFTVCLTMQIPWQQALGAVFIAGAIFLGLSFFAVREKLMDIIPDCLKNSIAAGIGLLITIIGFEWSGIIVDSPGTLVQLGNLKSTPVLVSLFGILLISFLLIKKIRGAILFGILGTGILAWITGLTKFEGLFSTPPSLFPTFFKLQIFSNFSFNFLTVILIFLFLDIFDTVGTLIGVTKQAGLLVDGKLPGARKAFFSDACGTVSGALLGTSTITSYIESSAGIASGGRSGFSNIVTGFLFLISIFFYPLVKMFGGGYEIMPKVFLYPITAPVLILIGSFMIKTILDIKWDDYTESIPSFLTMMIMPLTFSITEGIAFGFISYSLLKTMKGDFKKVGVINHVLAFILILRYIFLV
ncbi:NCS2 family permease [bacterium]|nr:NCS2 family permease [bacterium]